MPVSSQTDSLENDMIFVSQEFAYAVKTDDSASAEKYRRKMASVSEDELGKQLNSEGKIKAFWLNVYNANIQYLLKKNAGLYQKRGKFFGKKRITIAGKSMSLDDLEHGIIRRSKIKLSLGYLNKWFKSSFEKRFRWSGVDHRIHFALNCGAKSCPPVAFYSPETVERELEIAMKGYLENECEYKPEEDEVWVPALFGWFRADFGGKKGMIKLLKKYEIIPETVSPKIKYLEYSWDLELDKYA